MMLQPADTMGRKGSSQIGMQLVHMVDVASLNVVTSDFKRVMMMYFSQCFFISTVIRVMFPFSSSGTLKITIQQFDDVRTRLTRGMACFSCNWYPVMPSGLSAMNMRKNRYLISWNATRDKSGNPFAAWTKKVGTRAWWGFPGTLSKKEM